MIHGGSTECATAGVDIFSPPCTKTAIAKSNKVDFYPVATLSHPGLLEFAIPAAVDDYWDLNDHYQEIKFKIVKRENGSNRPNFLLQ